jgi:hypothetical protein
LVRVSAVNASPVLHSFVVLTSSMSRSMVVYHCKKQGYGGYGDRLRWSYCTIDLEYLVGHWKNIDDILMRSKIPSLVEMKRFCAWTFVSSSYIGGDISGQNYLRDTISLNKLTSFSL